SKRARLPGIIGLILGGLLVGPHALGLLTTSLTIELLATVGLVYLMFSAGLEIDLHQLGRVRHKALVFGLLTFAIPQLGLTALGRALGFGWASSILLGSTFASHTLIAYPILSRLGIVRNEAIAVVVGATVFTDVASLLVLAIVAGTQSGGVSALSLVRLIVLMIGYTLLVLLGLPRIGKWFFRRFSSRDVEFQFVLVALFVAALLAELIGMHAIVGAFLAGLAINATLPAHSAVGGQILFLGESLFIPMFMIYVGLIINPLAFVTDRQALLLGLAMTAGVYVTKFAAAWVTSVIFRYSRDELLTFWGLSQAQAAATVATILVGVEIGLFPMAVFNGVILSILCTCITSPLLVQRFGSRLHPTEAPHEKKPLFDRILVPIANPQTEEHLLTLADILSRSAEGTLLPLHVAKEVNGRVVGLEHQQRLLERVPEILKHPETRIQPVRRVAVSIARGILHAAIENEASLIIIGWHGKPTFSQGIFGSVLDKVIWNATVPVLVGRLTIPINAVKRVVLVAPPNSLTLGLARKTLEVVLAIARAINVPLLIMATRRYAVRLRDELGKLGLEQPYKIAYLEEAIRDVVDEAGPQDLILVTTMGSRLRFRSSLGDIPEQLAAAMPGPIVVIHYP
ncbi:MAG TPA: cation:proton antiporter, partial [Anaerolineae bacterium]|nr:cation:proton antiporter [Anaerolineae bacterium]